MNVSLNTMRYFIDIVEQKSFTKAAEKNYVAQTSLSHAIVKLEYEMDAKLLIRSPGNVEPTEAGKAFFLACKEMLDTYQKMLQKVNFFKTQMKNVQIGFIDIFECVDFMKLQEKLKNTLLNHVFRWTDRYSITDDSLDIMIGYSYERRVNNQNKVRKINIAKNRLSFLVSKQNALSRKKNICIQDLKGQTVIILLRDRNINTEIVEGRLFQKYLKDADCKIHFVYSAMERRTLTECNNGIAIFEKDLFKYDKETCETVDIGFHFPLSYIVSYKGEEMRPAVRLIENFLMKQL